MKKEIIATGIDIGSAAVKAVKLRFLPDTIELLDLVWEPINVDTGETLKKIAQVINTQKANLSVSGGSSVTRYVLFPKMSAAELKQALNFEAQKHMPFNLSDVSLDCSVLKENLPDNKMLVLLAAAKKELVSQRLKACQDAGIKTNLIDLDSLALINAFNFNYGQEGGLADKTVALLNIGSVMSNISILDDGIPYLSRDIQLAGNSFIQRVADVQGLDFKAAQEMLQSPQPDSRAKVVAAVEPVFSRLANEARSSFDYYETESASSVAKIFLSGGGSLCPGIVERLASLVGMEAAYWDPFKKIDLKAASSRAQKIKEPAAQFAVAVGLALRR